MLQSSETVPSSLPSPEPSRADDLVARYRELRQQTEKLCDPLAIEDYVIQSMPDASPAKWHLAHTTWFFENFILKEQVKGYEPHHPAFGFLFNSYYESVGPAHERGRRGLLSRPTVAEIHRYRRAIDELILTLVQNASPTLLEAIAPLLVLGLNHEQQHQELLLTDILHAYWSNPLKPAYSRSPSGPAVRAAEPLEWIHIEGGLSRIGNEDPSLGAHAFAFDNERPAHDVYLRDYRIASRPVTNGEFLEFIEAGGYRSHVHWLSDGWKCAREGSWEAPLYWERKGSEWFQFTLSGLRPLRLEDPVSQVSYYEADAFARWKGRRLPTEQEWENAYDLILRSTGEVWEWAGSAYLPYPGFRALAQSIGEYNGKFMSGQMVLRGGSAATPAGHVRRTYRNFFQPAARWQFSGIRLAEDVA